MRRDEDKLQILCVKFLTYRYSHLMWNHSSNEGKRSDREGARLKKMGMQPGYPDLDIIDGARTIHIEFKTEKGRQSPEQKKIQERLEEQGREYIICRSYDQFIQICHSHFGPEKDPDMETLRKILNK